MTAKIPTEQISDIRAALARAIEAKAALQTLVDQVRDAEKPLLYWRIMSPDERAVLASHADTEPRRR